MALRDRAVVFLDQLSGLGLEDLVALGQQTGLCPPRFTQPARRKVFFEHATWGFLDFDRLGVDGAPTVDDVDRRFESMGLQRAVVLSKSNLKEKNGVVAERAHFVFPFSCPCASFESFRETMRALATEAKVLAHVDRASFVANQPLWPGSRVLKVVTGGRAVPVRSAATSCDHTPIRAERHSSRAVVHASTLPPSIEGRRGRHALYAVANVLIHEDSLSAADAVAVIETHFNPRCVPPWSPREIRQVVANAMKNDRHDPKLRAPTAVAELQPTRSAAERARYDGWFSALSAALRSPNEAAHADVYAADELLNLVDSSGDAGDRSWLGKVMRRLGWTSTRRGRRQEKVYVRPSAWARASEASRMLPDLTASPTLASPRPPIMAHTTSASGST